MNRKQKNIALILGFILLLWISYQLSFSKTIALKKQYNNIKKEAQLFENSSQKLLNLERENQYYDSILKSKQISTHKSFQNNLLSTINSYASANSITVVSFQNPHVFKQENSEILTYSFTLKGNFKNITQLIYQLEQEFKLGKIISVNYTKKRDYRRRSNYLECTILLQNVNSKRIKN